MTRQTSIEVYNRIKAEGLLSKLRQEVYQCLFHHGDLTQTECYKILGKSRESVTPRFAELLDRGVIREVGVRPCKINGTNCISWDVTDKLPIDPPKLERNAEKIERLEKELIVLKEENRILKLKLDKKSFEQGFLFQNR